MTALKCENISLGLWAVFISTNTKQPWRYEYHNMPPNNFNLMSSPTGSPLSLLDISFTVHDHCRQGKTNKSCIKDALTLSFSHQIVTLVVKVAHTDLFSGFQHVKFKDKMFIYCLIYNTNWQVQSIAVISSRPYEDIFFFFCRCPQFWMPLTGVYELLRPTFVCFLPLSCPLCLSTVHLSLRGF